MRRIAVAVVGAVMMLGVPSAPAGAVVGQNAFAVWVRVEKGRHVAYFADLERSVYPAGWPRS